MKSFARYQRWRILRKYPIPDAQWHRYTRNLPLLHGLGATERAYLRELSTLFLHAKSFSAAYDLVITARMKIIIAAQACLPILALGMDAYAGWQEIILYPEAFIARRQRVDAAGVVSLERQTLNGESWSQGPVVLSWAEVAQDSLRLIPGRHIVIHEFAHKLDWLNGRANGMPPLHPNMPIEAWTQALSQAYMRLQQRIQRGQRPYLDAYAATSPAEFFAVVCEYFFTAPRLLHRLEPQVYAQLQQYFLQDPRLREL